MLNQTLTKEPGESLQTLAAIHRIERLQLALGGAREIAFDWSLPDDRIAWEGARNVLALHHNPDCLSSGDVFRAWMSEPGREKLREIVEGPSQQDSSFAFEFEAPSALGSEWLEIRGLRVPGPDGSAERLVGLMRIATERVRDAQRLHYLATRDELTGHLNRTSLRAELSEAIEDARRENCGCAFLVASIDRLAALNDAYGFGAADEAIVAVGERLAGSLRGTDVIGRTAGNKFGVLVGNCSEREVVAVAERLRASVRGEVIATRGGTVSATISVGAVCLPGNASSSQEAMLRAEEALDHARAKGRDGFSLYAKSAQRETARLRLMAIADEVVAALHEKRLVFAYQPIISAKSREPVHHECLLRMIRADGSVVSAGHFIPAAEQLGLVRLVDRHALEMTIEKLQAHPDANLAVNVSGTTAGDPSWLQSFVNYVRANKKVAHRMIVELTETAALHDFEESAKFISTLRELGCRVAIDDFGAGYTSFRNLQMLRVDMVKIDGTYIRALSASPDNQIFVRTLIDLAKNFNLETVAEWVGSDEDADLLETFGVDYFQGFHVGEPQLEPDWMKAR
ncbi:MAG: GGDEF and EAL domain-containing protein [Alphaproteobacteria bacterium]|nr:GGDEF and EAL domain-containing protein [Alphaproteobacteria bacterium]